MHTNADGKDGVGGITTLKDEATGTLVYMPPPKGTFEPHHQPAVCRFLPCPLLFSLSATSGQVDVILDLLKTHAEGEITILTIGVPLFPLIIHNHAHLFFC